MTYIRILLCLSLILATAPPLAAGDPVPAAQTFEDWVVLQVEGETLYARRSDFDAKYAASQNGTAKEIQRIQLYAFKFENAVPNGAPPIVQVTATQPKLELKIYPKSPAGVALAACPPGKSCDGKGDIVDQRARICDEKNLYSCGGKLGARWKRTQSIDVAQVDPRFGNRDAIFGSEESSLARLTPKQQWLMKTMRRKAQDGGDPGAYREIMRSWSQFGEFDQHNRLKHYFDPKTGHLSGELDKDVKLAMKGEGDEATPDFLGSLTPLEQEYIKTMLPQSAQNRLSLISKDKKLTPEKATELASYIRSQVNGELSGKGTAAEAQLKFLAANFKGIGEIDDEAAAALTGNFDGALTKKKKKTAGDGDGDSPVVAGDINGKKESVVGDEACKHKDGCGNNTLKSKEVPLTADMAVGGDGAPVKKASMLGGLGKYAKNPMVMGGAGMLLGGILGMMMFGPLGMMMGAMAAGFIGAGVAQVATNNSK